MPHSHGTRVKARSILTKSNVVRGVSYLLYDYKVGDKVVVDVDPREHNTTPHRRFHGKIGVIEEVGRRTLKVSVMIGNKKKILQTRFNHIKLLAGPGGVTVSNNSNNNNNTTGRRRRCYKQMTEIIKKEIVTLPQVKEILESVKLDDMDQIQRWTADYVKKFSKVESQRAQTMIHQLIEQCDLTEEEAVEIVNIMPTSLEELRAFTFGWKKLILTDTLGKMLNILKAEDTQS